MKKYVVHLVKEAEIDLIELYHYVSTHDTHEAANSLIDNIESVCSSLERMPERSHCPPELQGFPLISFKEIFYKPYRIIYQIKENTVYIFCILDGRRDILSLLENRLLRV